MAFADGCVMPKDIEVGQEVIVMPQRVIATVEEKTRQGKHVWSPVQFKVKTEDNETLEVQDDSIMLADGTFLMRCIEYSLPSKDFFYFGFVFFSKNLPRTILFRLFIPNEPTFVRNILLTVCLHLFLQHF